MNSLDKEYTDLLKDILNNGTSKSDRTGTGTISVFGRQIRHNMKDGFPLLTTKKMPFKTIVTELLWFLRGDTNIKYLVDNNCHIWDGDAYKNYCMSYKDGHEFYEDETVKRSYTQEEFINKIKTDDEFANKWGELGKIYGWQWRKWGSIEETKTVRKKILDQENLEADIFYEQIINKIGGIDQIANLINDLKTNPDSRRLMVNAWNVGELDQMVLPPCHYGFQVYTRELSFNERMNLLKNLQILQERRLDNAPQEMVSKLADSYNIPTRAISLMWNQRSVDTFLGLPFNIASYGLLLEIISKEVNMVPDELIGNLGDVHLYLNHIEQAKEQIGRYLTDEERYNIWFNNNYETGMERFFDPDNLPDYNNEYYEPTPKRTREPFPLPTLKLGHFGSILENVSVVDLSDFILENYQSHPTIKAPLSN
jgi:thymidylate synthase